MRSMYAIPAATCEHQGRQTVHLKKNHTSMGYKTCTPQCSLLWRQTWAAMSTKFGNFKALPSPSFKKSSKLPANAELTQKRDVRKTTHQNASAAICAILKTAMFQVQGTVSKNPIISLNSPTVLASLFRLACRRMCHWYESCREKKQHCFKFPWLLLRKLIFLNFSSAL